MSCHRHLYKQSVVQFVQTRYKQACQELLTKMVKAFGRTHDDRMYVCLTCRSYISQNKLPPQAAVNGLQLDDVPASLHLTDLESTLIAQRVPSKNAQV